MEKVDAELKEFLTKFLSQIKELGKEYQDVLDAHRDLLYSTDENNNKKSRNKTNARFNSGRGVE